jgi:DUF917 family protein
MRGRAVPAPFIWLVLDTAAVTAAGEGLPAVRRPGEGRAFQTNQLQMMRMGMTMVRKMFTPDKDTIEAAK